MYIAPNEGKGCDLDKGKVLRTWPTGDEELGGNLNVKLLKWMIPS